MAQKGDIVYIENFQFSDGTIGKKLAVILHDGRISTPYLLVKTTSNPKRYSGVNPGCSVEKKVFFIPQGKDGLHTDTYVQLDDIIPFDAIEMVRGHWSKTIKYTLTLQPQRFNELRNCLRRLKDDIPVRYFQMLFGK